MTLFDATGVPGSWLERPGGGVPRWINSDTLHLDQQQSDTKSFWWREMSLAGRSESTQKTLQ